MSNDCNHPSSAIEVRWNNVYRESTIDTVSVPGTCHECGAGVLTTYSLDQLDTEVDA